jgi:hypothetical protein
MSRELVAIVALALTLGATVFSFGIRIGTLSERVELQTKAIDLLQNDLRAINNHFILWAAQQRDP